ncbi:hypothetical protein EP1X_09885 [Thermococcus sp. EP1]|uniref:hypothetical protein n=1 Tax=Thermococcus sp. EP1 TaxID=1591054 RepID=UPI0006D9D4A7|nr:hypothetical protein [Thermococcus sp. EP1]KPU62227.1 hypothetical protein EP1X_09885 [Thermococcus sp. EP1]
MKGIAKGIIWAILIIMITVAVSVWQGWIPYSKTQNNPIVEEDAPNTEIPSSGIQKLLGQYNYYVEYFWSNRTPTLNLIIEGPPRNLTVILSDPHGATVGKVKILKEDLLDEKELVSFSFYKAPFKLGEYTLILYDPTEDKVVYKKTLKLFEEPKILVGDIIPKIDKDSWIGGTTYYLDGFQVQVTNRGNSPVKVCGKATILSSSKSSEVDLGWRYLPKNGAVTVDKDLDNIKLNPGEGAKIEVWFYDCYTGKLLGEQSLVIQL